MLGGLVQSRRVFLVTGYISVPEAPKLQKALESRFDVVVELTEPSDQDDVPVILHNN